MELIDLYGEHDDRLKIFLVRFTQGMDGNGGCWDMLGLSLIIIMDHEPSLPTFSTSKKFGDVDLKRVF